MQYFDTAVDVFGGFASVSILSNKFIDSLKGRSQIAIFYI